MIRTLKNFYHLIVAIIANIWFGFPSREVTVIGVTGTDGKTTTSSLIYHILKYAGKQVSLVSTVYAKIGEEEYDTGFHVSTPHSFTVQNFLRNSVNNGDEFFVMETTSHALDQNRVFGVRYEIGVITNITHEHLDYHGTYERYVAAKLKLFDAARYRVANNDDESYHFIKKRFNTNVITYGLKQADYAFDISKKINKPLPKFNKYNFLAAYAVTKRLKIPDQIIFEAMRTFQMPAGRMEVLETAPVTAIVDFAHTPHSIKEALSSIRKEYIKKKSQRLIHVFGCAAKRDELKRPIMGEESGTYADLVILTEEDYRDEDVNEISYEIAVGLHKAGFSEVTPEEFGIKNQTFTLIGDRGEAIKKAFAISQPGDVLVFTGKGHEKSLCRGTTEFPWNEREAVQLAFEHHYAQSDQE
jgi:UDP-N-acetylmuramoyl-L-alanyl-D-glutamate--2,6-diaminopimelate ligase